VLTSGDDGIARLWAVEKPDKPLAEFKHGGKGVGATFGREERDVVTWGEDGIARLWEPGILEPLGLVSHGGPIFHASFSEDGSRLLTRNQDVVRVTAILPREFVHLSESIADADLALEVEVQTGTRLDATGAVVALSPDEWRERQRELEKIKGK
jgi:hypothetical protein